MISSTEKLSIKDRAISTITPVYREGEMLKLVLLTLNKNNAHIETEVHKTVKTAEKIITSSSIDRATTRVRVDSISYFLVKEK